jgi:hypothetical protein
MRLIGALSTGETPSAEEQADALEVLNEMLDSWSLENLVIPSRTREEFDLVGAQQTYTMGSGGNFNTSRPARIEAAGILDLASPANEIPIDLINMRQWSEITVKGTSSTYPTKLYVENTSPLERLNFWPIPSAAYKVAIYSAKPLTAVASANTTLSLPPGYLKALRYNLAIELAPEFGKSVSAEIIKSAEESKENIKRLNIKPVLMSADEAVLQHSSFNWITGD